MTCVTGPSIAYVATQVSLLLYTSTLVLTISFLPKCRFDLLSVLPLFSPGQTLPLILNDFTIQFSTYLKMTRRKRKWTTFLLGGTGILQLYQGTWHSLSDCLGLRQVFPTYSTRNRLPAVNNVLAKIKAKRIAMRNLDQNSAGGDWETCSYVYDCIHLHIVTSPYCTTIVTSPNT